MLVHNMAFFGGAFLRAYSLSRGLANRGHEITLIAGRHSAGSRSIRTLENGVEIVQMADVSPSRIRHGGLSPFDVAGRVRWLEPKQFDIVHAFDHRPAVSVPALWIARRKGIPLVGDWADLWGLEGIGGQRSRWEYPLAHFDHISERNYRRRLRSGTFASSFLRDTWRSLDEKKRDLVWLPAGANTDLITPGPRSEAKRALGISVEHQVVVHSGFAPYDDPLMRDSLVKLARKSRSNMVVVCGSKHKDLERAFNQADLGDQLINLGYVEFRLLGNVLAAADVLFLPYSNRTVNLGRFPNKLGDYLAAGRPIVSNPTGDVGEIIRANKLGLLPGESSEEIAEAISDLFHDPDRASFMGETARRLAVEEFSWQVLAQKIERFYVEIIGSQY